MSDRILILGDVHAPFHDRKAWELVLAAGRKLKPAAIWLLGDFVDCWSVSSHDKDPQRQLSLREELASARYLLDQLDRLGAPSKIYVAGNHEDRLRRFLGTNARELEGLISIESSLDLATRGWTYVPYKSHRKVGKLHLTHDVGATGRQTAFRALDVYQHSVLTGHSHRLCYIVEGNAVGEQKLSATFGWLGDVNQIDYMHEAKARKDWALGFGVGTLGPGGLVYVTPVPILRKPSYSCCIDGQILRA
jgi:predicted phosphodiesterase